MWNKSQQKLKKKTKQINIEINKRMNEKTIIMILMKLDVSVVVKCGYILTKIEWWIKLVYKN